MSSNTKKDMESKYIGSFKDYPDLEKHGSTFIITGFKSWNTLLISIQGTPSLECFQWVQLAAQYHLSKGT